MNRQRKQWGWLQSSLPDLCRLETEDILISLKICNTHNSVFPEKSIHVSWTKECPQFNLIISKRRRPSIAHSHNQSIRRRGWGDSSYIENTVIIYFTTNLITQTGERLFPQVLDFADTREHPLGSKWHNFSHKKWRSVLCVCPAGSGNSIRA